ncbi:MAG TPA: hypothetical protein VGL77_18650 [Armatimonadota bacterium]|jgi:hypothetical protein
MKNSILSVVVHVAILLVLLVFPIGVDAQSQPVTARHPVASSQYSFAWNQVPETSTESVLATAAQLQVDASASAIILLDEDREVVYPDLSVELRDHFIFKALAKDVSYQSLVGDDSFDVSTVESCHIIHANGTQEVVSHANFKRRLTAPVLPGDIVDITAHERRNRQAHAISIGGWIFNDAHYFVVQSRFVLIAPTAFKYETLTHGLVPSASVRDVDGWHIVEWRATNLAPVLEEEQSPAFMDRMNWIMISTTTAWRECVQWYKGLIKPFCLPDATTRAKAVALTKEAKSEDEKIYALVAFVMNLKSRSHNRGVIPAKPSQVLRDKYGDCKDKSMLLYALLASINVKSDLVLLCANTTSEVMRANDFLHINHANVLVHTVHGVLWIDPTANILMEGDSLLFYDEGVPALIINDATTGLTTTPILPVEKHATASVFFLTLSEAGRLQGTVSARSTGSLGAAWRECQAMPTAQYKQTLQLVLTDMAGDAQLDNGAFTDTGHTITDAIPGFTATFHLDHGATRKDDTLQLSSLPLKAPIPLVDPTPRKTDADISATYGKYVTDISLELPVGYTLPQLPEANVTSPWGSYRKTATLQGNMLIVHWEATQTVLRVPVKETAQYYAFMYAMYQASTTPLILKKIDVTSLTAPALN